MNIPSFVTNQIPKDPFANDYFYHAEENWTRLEAIVAKRIPYISSDFSMLVNTLEMYYKGFLKSMSDNVKGYSLPEIPNHKDDNEYFLKKDHHLAGLVEEIEDHFLNISPTYTKKDRRDHDRFLNDLQWEYTKARYTTYPSFEDFKKVYQFASNQRNSIRDYITDKLLPKEQEHYDINL